MLMTVVMGLWSCSADNEEDFALYGNNVAEKANIEGEAASMAATTCLTDLTAKVQVDVSNGMGNPVVVFTPVITDNVSARAKFRVRVEVQPLANCDNMGSDTGSLLTFGPLGAVQNVVSSPPAISVSPANMPLCYKWRYVFESPSGVAISSYCYSATVWYESPLF